MATAFYVLDEGGRGYRSSDAGRTWWKVLHRASVGAGDPPWLHVANQSYFATADIQYDPVQPGRLWVGAGLECRPPRSSIDAPPTPYGAKTLPVQSIV